MSRCCFNRKLLENQKVARKLKSCRKDTEHLVANPTHTHWQKSKRKPFFIFSSEIPHLILIQLLGTN